MDWRTILISYLILFLFVFKEDMKLLSDRFIFKRARAKERLKKKLKINKGIIDNEKK